MHHFALRGYEGASLAHIAKDVGIKKQSIYTYFAGKDDLFLQICEDACKFEISMVMEDLVLAKDKPIKNILYNFLEQSMERYAKYDSTKFMLGNAFLPPVHLREQVMSELYSYLDKLEELFIPIFNKAKEAGEISSMIDEEMATAAFLAVLDSLFVEMLYGDAHRLKKRFHASWYLFWCGLTAKEMKLEDNKHE